MIFLVVSITAVVLLIQSDINLVSASVRFTEEINQLTACKRCNRKFNEICFLHTNGFRNEVFVLPLYQND